MIVSKSQKRAFEHIAAGEMSAGISAEQAKSELEALPSTLGLPEKVLKRRIRPYRPRPTRRTLEHKLQ